MLSGEVTMLRGVWTRWSRVPTIRGPHQPPGYAKRLLDYTFILQSSSVRRAHHETLENNNTIWISMMREKGETPPSALLLCFRHLDTTSFGGSSDPANKSTGCLSARSHYNLGEMVLRLIGCSLTATLTLTPNRSQNGPKLAIHAAAPRLHRTRN